MAIFSWLQNPWDMIQVGRICKLFYKLIQHPDMWHTLDVHYGKDKPFPPRHSQLRLVHHLTLRFFPTSPHCNSDGYPTHIRSEFSEPLQCFLDQVFDIHQLNLVNISRTMLLYLSRTLPRNGSLRLIDIEVENKEHITLPLTVPLVEFLEFHKLKGLRLACSVGSPFAFVLRSFMNPYTPFPPQLKFLMLLIDREELKPSFMQTISKYTALEELTIGSCDKWTEETYGFLERLKRMRKLTIMGMDEDHLPWLVKPLRALVQLKVLTLGWLSEFRAEVLMSVLKTLPKFCLLEVISIAGKSSVQINELKEGLGKDKVKVIMSDDECDEDAVKYLWKRRDGNA